jgi:hypothetical protein
MASLIQKLLYWWINPRLYVTAISIGVAFGTAMSIYTGRIDLIGGPFVWAGCVIILRRVWQTRAGWPEILRSKAFWVGVAAMIVGNLITSVRSK